VLADFANSTGDPVFDGTLREALSNQVENSNTLRTMSPGQVSLILADMMRPPDTPITAAVANEICIRAREKATMAGSIAVLGSTYVLTLKATNCQTGETLASELVEAAGKENVLAALAQAVSGIREKLGESLPDIQRTLADASVATGTTTASLEAYQAFAMGITQTSQGKYAAAIPHFDRAIQLDPNLAIGYTQGTIAYQSVGQRSRARELFRKGFEHRMEASERERLWIEGRYYQAEGNLDKARPVFEELVRLYPNAALGFNSIGTIYRQFGEFEKALPMWREIIRLALEATLGHEQLSATFVRLDRFEEAHAAVEMPAMKRLDSPETRLILLRLGYLEGDLAAAQVAIRALEGTRLAVRSLLVQQSYAFAVGKFRNAEALQAKASEAARRQNLGRAASDMKLEGAAFKANVGLCSDVEATVSPELLKPDISWAPGVATALATCGDVAKAQRLADSVAKMDIGGQVWDSLQLPLIRARTLLAQGKPVEAIAALEIARAFERASPDIALARGEAYLMSNKPSEAAAEFRKVVDVKSNLLTSGYNAAQVGLTRALAAAGDAAGAKKAYEAFFDLWKSADPGIPLLLAAQKEYAALR
jgi:tetratricopeptide (TPR) repeat protein